MINMKQTTSDTGFICDWCGRGFGFFVSQYVIDGLTMCPVCYRREFKDEKEYEC